MNKRLRKKKHVGQFAEWGCRLIAVRNTKANADDFHDSFLREAIEANGCSCGGGLYDDKVDVIVQLGRKSDNPDEKFAGVTAWLDARPDVEQWKASPLFDLWHGKYPDSEEDFQ